jgi:two-component system sensor kinase FixL
MTVRCCRKDGSEYEASLLSSPVPNKMGLPEQYFVSFVDLTQHFKMRHEEYSQAVALYQHAPGFIKFTEGPEHRITFANPAYENLVGRRISIGTRVADAIPEFVEQQFIEMFDSVYRSGQHIEGSKVPIKLIRQDNGIFETRFINFVYQAVRDADGKTVGLFCQGSDVTEMQRSAEKLGSVQAQLIHVSRLSAMGTMAAVLAHELNQPLAAIANYAVGCTTLLKEGGPNIRGLDQGLQAITSASLRAGRIISKLRNMTRRSIPTSEIFCLTEAMREAVKLVRAGGCHGVTISLRGNPVIPVKGDRIQVQQVIINLLRNACEAALQSNRKGAVLVVTSVKEGSAFFVVRDNGLGVSDQVKSNLFSWTDTTKPDGTGIGLSISRTIIDELGGTIRLDESSTAGSSFSFCLPLAFEIE